MEPPKAKPGGDVMTWAENLVTWAIGHRKFAGAGVRLTETPRGTWINATADHTWEHPFRVSVEGGDRVRVRYGTVGGDVPRIDGVRLDATDMDYKPTDEEAPTLDISGDTVADGRSFVQVRLVVDPASREPDPADPAALTITHRRAEEITAEAADDLVGRAPLALIYWSGGSVAKVEQIAHHNLVHLYVPGTDETPARHHFGAT